MPPADLLTLMQSAESSDFVTLLIAEEILLGSRGVLLGRTEDYKVSRSLLAWDASSTIVASAGKLWRRPSQLGGLGTSLWFIWRIGVFHHFLNVMRDVLISQERCLCRATQSFLINSLFLCKQLPGPFNWHTMRIFRVLICHNGDYIVLFSSSKHCTCTLASSKWVIIRQVLKSLISVSLSLLKQLLQHIVLLRSLPLNLIDKCVHIFVLGSLFSPTQRYHLLCSIHIQLTRSWFSRHWQRWKRRPSLSILVLRCLILCFL